MTQCAGAQPGAPECDSYTRPQDSPENRGSASEVQFSGLKIQIGKGGRGLDHQGFL